MPSVDEAVRQIMASRYQPRVGDRVRVTEGIAECQPAGHFESELGACGKVVETSPQFIGDPNIETHPVAVSFDKPGLVVDGVLWSASFYASAELELLEPTTDDERRMQGREGLG